MQLTGKEKATIFLSILGTDTSSRILRYLPEELADIIASSVNHLPTPTPDALGEVLNDFRSYTALPAPAAPHPAASVPTPMPHRAGESATPEIHLEPGTPRETLEHAPAQAIAFVLSDERPQMIAFVLSRLSAAKREEVLAQITAQKDIVLDLLSGMRKSPVAQRIEEKLLADFAEKLK